MNTEQKINYQKILDTIINNIKSDLDNSQNKPKLLLHACCAPCSSYVIEYLSEYFDITILYYNPNIYPTEEYNRRLQELIDFLPKFTPAQKNNVKLIQQDYNPQEFYDSIQIKNYPELATEKEKGIRCYNCYKFRLKKSFDYALQNNFDWFTTTLSISPFKDSEKINSIGKELEQTLLKTNPSAKLKFLSSDFKKKGGFKRSLEISSEYNLYRQQYCGCVYSMNNSSN